MNWSDALQIGTTVVGSLGGGGLIVFGLSSWLGKVWANRLMDKERQGYAVELEELKNSLRRSTDTAVKTLEAQLDLGKREHLDRVTIYRGAMDLLAEIIAKVELITLEKRESLGSDELLSFEIQRLRIYAYLAMHAPQSVIDAHDALVQLTLDIAWGIKSSTWQEIRELSLHFLNEVRRDIGIDKEPMTYHGNR